MTEEEARETAPVVLDCGPTLLKLDGSTAVAVDHVSSVRAESRFLLIRMKDGETHKVYPNYGESVYQALDRLLKEVNGA